VEITDLAPTWHASLLRQSSCDRTLTAVMTSASAREQIRTDEHVAVAVSELRAETRLAALEEHIKAPRPSCQSAYLSRISASVGFDVDRATAGGS
jgi:hypothetical protein